MSLLFRDWAVVEAIVTIAASIASLAAQHRNETLEDILPRNTVDLPTLTFWTDVLPHHSVDPDIESGDSKHNSGMMSGSDIINKRPPIAGAGVAGPQREQRHASLESTKGFLAHAGRVK